ARESRNEMAKAIDASPFFVDHENGRAARDRFHFADQLAKLLRIGDVAAEEHDRVGTRFADDLLFEIRQRFAGKADAEYVHVQMLTANRSASLSDAAAR